MYVPVNLLRYDYWLQTVLIVLNVILTVSVFGKPDMILAILWFQLLLGSVQFISALVHISRPVLNASIKKWRTLHLTVSLLLLMTLILTAFFRVENSSPFGNYGTWIVFWSLILGLPQILSYTYYYLTYLDYSTRTKYMQSRIS